MNRSAFQFLPIQRVFTWVLTPDFLFVLTLNPARFNPKSDRIYPKSGRINPKSGWI